MPAGPRQAGSALPECGIDGPAAAHVGARPAQMTEEGRVAAASFFEGVGQDGEAAGVQGAGGQVAVVVGGLRQLGYGSAENIQPDLAAIGPEATAEGGVSDLRALATSASERRSRRPKRANTVVRCPFLPATFWTVILNQMSDVTRILSAIEQGDPHAAEQLLPLVYDELRQLAAQKLAQEKPGHTLQATALVHEAYLRLVDTD